MGFKASHLVLQDWRSQRGFQFKPNEAADLKCECVSVECRHGLAGVYDFACLD